MPRTQRPQPGERDSQLPPLEEVAITVLRNPPPADFGAAFVAALNVERVAVSTLGEPFDIETVSASDDVAARLIEAQLDSGEGPSWDAHRSRSAVLVRRLDQLPDGRWPAFRHTVVGLRVEAVYSFPLAVGTLRIGAVDLYAESPNALTPAAIADATQMAERAAASVLDHALHHRNDPPIDDGPFSRREVHQATGMVVAQLRIPAADALALIRAHAYASDRTVRETAADIIARRLSLEP